MTKEELREQIRLEYTKGLPNIFEEACVVDYILTDLPNNREYKIYLLDKWGVTRTIEELEQTIGTEQP